MPRKEVLLRLLSVYAVPEKNQSNTTLEANAFNFKICMNSFRNGFKEGLNTALYNIGFSIRGDAINDKIPPGHLPIKLELQIYSPSNPVVEKLEVAFI